jgi:DNA-binding MarR family transcriptional regulator
MNNIDTTVDLFLEAGRMIKKRITEDHLPFAQVEVLRFVHEEGSPTMRAIASYLHIAAPSATALVNQLVDGGYLRRVSDEHDRRQVRLSLTPKAKKALESIMQKRKKVFRAVLAGLSAQDHQDLQRILHRMITNK